MKVEAYLHFQGQAEEALMFYQNALKARVEMIMRFSESPVPYAESQLPPGLENKIMHASMMIGETCVMVSDGSLVTGQSMSGFSLSLEVGSESEARSMFESLAQGGMIVMPMGRTFWSECFGMVNDRFGVQWMVSVTSNGN